MVKGLVAGLQFLLWNKPCIDDTFNFDTVIKTETSRSNARKFEGTFGM
jgi:hypothetical protein